jgi:hypothetical protein
VNNLQEVRDTLLENADLTLSVDGEVGMVRLEFYPASYDGVVTFYCSDYSRLNYRKQADDREAIFVGETHVTIIAEKSSIAKLCKEDGWLEYNQEFMCPVVLVEVDGGGMLSVVCEKFSWQKGDDPIHKVL